MSRSRLAAVALLLPILVAPRHAPPAPQFGYEYSVKMICGIGTTSNPARVSFGVVPQTYATTVNIANVTDSVILFDKGIMLLLPPGAQKEQFIKPISKDSLRPNFGLATDCCARHTSGDAFQRGYDLVWVTDALNAFTEEAHRSGLEYFKAWYATDPASQLVTVDQLVAKWEVPVAA